MRRTLGSSKIYFRETDMTYLTDFKNNRYIGYDRMVLIEDLRESFRERRRLLKTSKSYQRQYKAEGEAAIILRRLLDRGKRGKSLHNNKRI